METLRRRSSVCALHSCPLQLCHYPLLTSRHSFAFLLSLLSHILLLEINTIAYKMGANLSKALGKLSVPWTISSFPRYRVGMLIH